MFHTAGLSRGVDPRWKNESFKASIFVVGVILFIGSGIVSFNELRYKFWGKTTTARIVSTRPVTSPRTRYGRSRKWMAVKYTWKDEARHERTDSSRMHELWQTPEDGTIRIDYRPYAKSSRPCGNANKVALVLFFGSTAVMIVLFILTARKAYI